MYLYCFSMLGKLFYPAHGGICSCEMLITVSQIAQGHTPEDGTLQNLFVLRILSGLMKPGVKLVVFVYIFVMYGFKNWNLLLYLEEFSSIRRFISCHHSNLIPWELTIYYSIQMDIFIHVLILWLRVQNLKLCKYVNSLNRGLVIIWMVLKGLWHFTARKNIIFQLNKWLVVINF